MLLRRYFAFILMLFTVASNAADVYTPNASGGSGNVSLVFASRLNEIINNNIIKANIINKRYGADKKSYGDFEFGANNIAHVFIILSAAVFMVCFLFINNGIAKNSIWKSAVF